MTNAAITERFADVEDGVDPEEFVAGLQYVRDDERRRHED